MGFTVVKKKKKSQKIDTGLVLVLNVLYKVSLI